MLAFGVAGLAGVAASVEPTLPVVARVVALNAMPGVVFGWLYITDALESATTAQGILLSHAQITFTRSDHGFFARPDHGLMPHAPHTPVTLCGHTRSCPATECRPAT